MIFSSDLGDFASDKSFDLSIPLRFNGSQPNVYDVSVAFSKACEYGDFVGDTRRGGSVNFEQYTFIPHCNGTHTECIGHITDERIYVRDCLKDVFTKSLLITVDSTSVANTKDTYPFETSATDQMITAEELERALESITSLAEDTTSLIIRSQPNEDRKMSRIYNATIPPFFSNEAMQVISERFEHLLVDLPSIDRIYDGGILSNHRIFWNIEPGGKSVTPETRVNSTVTELIYVPDQIRDGEYLLNLQITAFDADASPSRPLIFEPVP